MFVNTIAHSLQAGGYTAYLRGFNEHQGCVIFKTAQVHILLVLL